MLLTMAAPTCCPHCVAIHFDYFRRIANTFGTIRQRLRKLLIYWPMKCCMTTNESIVVVVVVVVVVCKRGEKCEKGYVEACLLVVHFTCNGRKSQPCFGTKISTAEFHHNLRKRTQRGKADQSLARNPEALPSLDIQPAR